MIRPVLAVLALTVACGGSSPTAPTPAPPVAASAPTVAPVAHAAAPAQLPEYVVIGDSVALRGPWWPTVEASLPPHLFINAAFAFSFLHTDWHPGGRAWPPMVQAIGTTMPTAFLVHIGANDTVAADAHSQLLGELPAPTEASVFADLQIFVAGLHAIAPQAPVYLAEVGQVLTYGDKHVENQAVNSAIHRAWVEIPGVRQGPQMQDLTPDDGVHFLGPENSAEIGRRWIAILQR